MSDGDFHLATLGLLAPKVGSWSPSGVELQFLPVLPNQKLIEEQLERCVAVEQRQKA